MPVRGMTEGVGTQAPLVQAELVPLGVLQNDVPAPIPLGSDRRTWVGSCRTRSAAIVSVWICKATIGPEILREIIMRELPVRTANAINMPTMACK